MAQHATPIREARHWHVDGDGRKERESMNDEWNDRSAKWVRVRPGWDARKSVDGVRESERGRPE